MKKIFLILCILTSFLSQAQMQESTLPQSDIIVTQRDGRYFVRIGTGKKKEILVVRNLYPNVTNTYLGNDAGGAISTGNRNVLIGEEAGYNVTTGSSNVILGSNVNAVSPTANGQLNIGNLIYGTGLYNSATNSSTAVTGGAIGIGTSTISASSILDINSTTQGVRLPRMTTTQRNAISSPAEGLEIYNLTTHTKDYWNGSAWKVITTN